MLKINNLSVSYGNNGQAVISNLSIELEKGNILNVLGQNAVGKTTLIRCIERELKTYTGDILIAGKDICTYDVKEYSKKVGVVSTSLVFHQNLLVADYLIAAYINQVSPFNFSINKYVRAAHEILDEMGKGELLNKYIGQLSSGEKQIVMIARVLIQNPEIIIVDEPTANLDVKNQSMVLGLLLKLKEKGYTVIITTHNPGHALVLGGKTLLMGKGIYEFGNTESILTEELLAKYYQMTVKIENGRYGTNINFFNEDSSSVKIVL